MRRWRTGRAPAPSRSRPSTRSRFSVLRPPGECGIDVAVGEGQPLGGRLDYGGPSFGFFAATEEHLRRMPGRIAGETTDVDGRRGFVLALQTREQHIRREKATHNICTSQALNALAGVVYLAWLGKRGFAELGELLVRRTATRASAWPRWRASTAPRRAGRTRVRGAARAAVAEVLDRSPTRMAGGYWLGGEYPEYADGLLVAITERRSKEDIDRLADASPSRLADRLSGEIEARAPAEDASGDPGPRPLPASNADTPTPQQRDA